MPMFRRGDVEIAFLDQGAGDPILLVHGFASNAAVNWVYPGWVATLNGAGLRVIALDNRGHGSSTKCYDPIAYHSATMAEDAHALLDHLDVPRADVMGYSMGARISAFLAVANPERDDRREGSIYARPFGTRRAAVFADGELHGVGRAAGGVVSRQRAAA